MSIPERRISDRKVIYVDFQMEGGYVLVNISIRHRLPIALIGLFVSALFASVLAWLTQLRP